MKHQEMVEVAAAVILNRGRVLIQQRQGTGHLDGFWEFPGGKVRTGEAPLQAALREVREETGLKLQATSVEPLHRLDHVYPDRCVRLHFFVCRLEGPRESPQPCTGLWVDLGGLEDYPFPPANHAVLDLLKRL